MCVFTTALAPPTCQCSSSLYLSINSKPRPHHLQWVVEDVCVTMYVSWLQTRTETACTMTDVDTRVKVEKR